MYKTEIPQGIDGNTNSPSFIPLSGIVPLLNSDLDQGVINDRTLLVLMGDPRFDLGENRPSQSSADVTQKKTPRLTMPKWMPEAVGLAVTTLTIIAASMIPSAGAEAQSIPLDTSSKKTLATGEQMTTDYYAERISVVGSRVAGLVKFGLTSNTRNRVVGDLDAANRLILQDKGVLPFYGLDVAVSETNPNIIAWVGDRAQRANDGKLFLSEDGGQTGSVYGYGGGALLGGRITPDNKYIFLVESDPINERKPIFSKFDRATRQFSQVTLPAGFPGVNAVDRMKVLAPDTYTSYSVHDLSWGYFKNTFYPDGSLTSEQLNADEGYLHGGVTWFVDSANNTRVWGIAPWESGIAPNDSSRPMATLYDNINDVERIRAQANQALYYDQITPGDERMIAIASPIPDLTSNKGYMTTAVNVNNVYYPHIEAFSIITPTDFSQHERLPEDGIYPRGGTHGSLNGVLKIAILGTERILLQSIRSDRLDESGLYRRRITNGINSIDVWEKVPLIYLPTPVYKIYLPAVMKNSQN